MGVSLTPPRWASRPEGAARGARAVRASCWARAASLRCRCFPGTSPQGLTPGCPVRPRACEEERRLPDHRELEQLQAPAHVEARAGATAGAYTVAVHGAEAMFSQDGGLVVVWG